MSMYGESEYAGEKNYLLLDSDKPMSGRDKIIKEAFKRTPIEGLEWVLEDDRFGFGINWSENDPPRCEEEWGGYYIQRAIEALKKYQKADDMEGE